MANIMDDQAYVILILFQPQDLGRGRANYPQS